MKIKDIIRVIEQIAPKPLQESYDNAGIQVGDIDQDASRAVICIDITEDVLNEAIEKNANLIISHHPLIFQGIKSITGKNYIERIIIKAIQKGICLYSAHTNLDNAVDGVNFEIAHRLGLENIRILDPKPDSTVLSGSGIVGFLNEPMDPMAFLTLLKDKFHCGVVQYSRPLQKNIEKVSICGGSASFLIPQAISSGADVYITGEIKYHEYFGNDEKILLAGIGHYESEQFTCKLITDIIRKEYPTFETYITKVKTNPINYL